METQTEDAAKIAPILYDYQKDMKALIEKSFQTFRSVMVQMPTGTGKTYLLAAVIHDFLHGKDQDSRSVVWIVAHRKELVTQIERSIMRFGMEIDHKHPTRCQVQVYSIQWLSKHITEIKSEGCVCPDLIVIDEAHHALAKTYAAVMNSFPKAKNLGLTATPCRLNGRSFVDLFDVILFSPSILQFIQNGYLSSFDYVSIPSDSEEILKIDALERRAADGDYNIAEMSRVLDCRPSIERLYKTVKDYARGKKGIVYAINIEHANHIADYYSEHGLKAIAISSKTKEKDRENYVRDFAEGRLSIIVNVDIFSEGFDCPDVDFIQMARPTLSLAKYLQQVGRGLRVAAGKEFCLLLDNVGLYRLFGLPTTNWDWKAMFFGEQRGKGAVELERVAYMNMIATAGRDMRAVSNDSNTDMVLLSQHDEMKELAMLLELVHNMNESFSSMRKLKQGWLFRQHYVRKVTTDGLSNYEIYTLESEKHLGWQVAKDENNVFYTFNERSESIVRIGKRNPWIPFVNEYLKLNPNITDEMPRGYIQRHDTYIWRPKLLPQDAVLRFEGLYGLAKTKANFVVFPMYQELSKAADGLRIFKTERDNRGIMTQDGDYYLLWKLSFVQLFPNGIAYVKEDDKNVKRGHWVNLYTMQEFEEQPEFIKCGAIKLLKVGDVYYFQETRHLAGIPLRKDEFAYNEEVFQFFEHYIILKDQLSQVYTMGRRLSSVRENGDIRYQLNKVFTTGEVSKPLTIRYQLLPKKISVDW